MTAFDTEVFVEVFDFRPDIFSNQSLSSSQSPDMSKQVLKSMHWSFSFLLSGSRKRSHKRWRSCRSVTSLQTPPSPVRIWRQTSCVVLWKPSSSMASRASSSARMEEVTGAREGHEGPFLSPFSGACLRLSPTGGSSIWVPKSSVGLVTFIDCSKNVYWTLELKRSQGVVFKWFKQSLFCWVISTHQLHHYTTCLGHFNVWFKVSVGI